MSEQLKHTPTPWHAGNGGADSVFTQGKMRICDERDLRDAPADVELLTAKLDAAAAENRRIGEQRDTLVESMRMVADLLDKAKIFPNAVNGMRALIATVEAAP
jgi:hypothetical protein